VKGLDEGGSENRRAPGCQENFGGADHPACSDNYSNPSLCAVPGRRRSPVAPEKDASEVALIGSHKPVRHRPTAYKGASTETSSTASLRCWKTSQRCNRSVSAQSCHFARHARRA